MARQIRKQMPEEFKKRLQSQLEQFERDDLPGLVSRGRALRDHRERLNETVRALKAERERQGMSLSEMERRTGISKSALSRLENDPRPNPTINTLMRIAEALGREITIQLAPPNEAA